MPSTCFPCPCCGYVVFPRPPGTALRCPVCTWEDDLAQLRFAVMPGSGNHVSLEQAQQNYVEFGSAERRHSVNARHPFRDEARDPAWRRLDRSRDNIEEPCNGTDYADSYPLDDTTVLYYWRPTYWRRYTS